MTYLKARTTNKSGTKVGGMMGVWGLCPQWGSGATPLVREMKPSEAGDILLIRS